ncbi:MAG TPA: hypothetical protein VJH22_02570 [Candidatus Nanoarchaeia archaeon]|nr:hypothetical protein [Candidatus Nanoarchaeia archaeon]
MNKRGILGTFLMQVYALLFLVMIFLAFLVIFPLAKGEVSSVGADQGDMFAEHLLADIIKEPAIEGGVITYQEAFNDPALREGASKRLLDAIEQRLRQLKISDWFVRIYLNEGEERSDLGNRALVATEGMSLLPTGSSVCWPFLDGDKVGFVEVMITTLDPRSWTGDAGGGYRRC